MKATYTEYPADDNDRAKRRDINDAQQMIYDAVGPENNRSNFRLGKYNAPFWNGEGIVNNNNCYAYACNIRVNNGIPDPGYRLYGKQVSSEGDLLKGVAHDGLVKIIDGEGATPPVHSSDEKPAWMVAMFCGANNDLFGYHFFRKVWSGIGRDCAGGRECYWSHKFLFDPVTNMSVDGNNRITDCVDEMNKLNTANGIKYNFEGYFLVKPDVKIGAPPIQW